MEISPLFEMYNTYNVSYTYKYIGAAAGQLSLPESLLVSETKIFFKSVTLTSGDSCGLGWYNILDWILAEFPNFVHRKLL